MERRKSQAALLLGKQLKEIKKNSMEGFSAGLVDEDIFRWQIIILGPPDTMYEGGFFKAIMEFPQNYPVYPPTLTFNSKIWHPNIFIDGRVCISILHPPGDDQWGYEKASERWSPVQTVESILLSVISLLSDFNTDSPANIDAAKQYKEDLSGFKKKVSQLVRKSQEDGWD